MSVSVASTERGDCHSWMDQPWVFGIDQLKKAREGDLESENLLARIAEVAARTLVDLVALIMGAPLYLLQNAPERAHNPQGLTDPFRALNLI